MAATPSRLGKDLCREGQRNQLRRMYRKYKGICFWCRKKVLRSDASREHLIPLRKFVGKAGAADWNVRLAHKWCNR